MSFHIVWTNTSIETYNGILIYLEDFWGLKEVNNFISQTDKVLKLVAKNPYMFKAVLENKLVRKGILHQNCSFLYRIIDDRVELLAFWDTRQQPFL